MSATTATKTTVSSLAVTTTKPGKAKPVAADRVLTDSTRLRTIDGVLISTPIARVTANQAYHGRTFNVTLANGTAAKLAKHTAADNLAPQTDQQWLVEAQKRVGRTINPLKD